MRKSTFSSLVAVILLAGCSSTPPHPGRWNPNGGPPRDENWHSPNATLMHYDANRDGIVTRAELIAGLKAEFDSYDNNHNNCLSPDEVRTINQTRVQQDASQATPLVDWNQDGCIDFHEYAGTLLSLFDSLDTNGDGQLTAGEINPATKGPSVTPANGKPGAHRGREPDGGEGGAQGEEPGEGR